MKYYATVNDQTYEIDIDHQDRITVDGQEMAANMRLVGGQHLYSLLIDNASYEILLDPEQDPRNTYGVMVSGLRYLVKVQDERSRRLALADRAYVIEGGRIVAQGSAAQIAIAAFVPASSLSRHKAMCLMFGLFSRYSLSATGTSADWSLRGWYTPDKDR